VGDIRKDLLGGKSSPERGQYTKKGEKKAVAETDMNNPKVTRDNVEMDQLKGERGGIMKIVK